MWSVLIPIALMILVIGLYRIITRPSATLEIRSFAMTWIYSMILPIIVVIVALLMCLR